MAAPQSKSRTQHDELSSGAWKIAFFGLPQLAFALPYITLLIWFHEVDVYHRHFSKSGIIVFVYNCFRVVFIFYLFLIVTTAGLLLLRTVVRRGTPI